VKEVAKLESYLPYYFPVHTIPYNISMVITSKLFDKDFIAYLLFNSEYVYNKVNSSEPVLLVIISFCEDKEYKITTSDFLRELMRQHNILPHKDISKEYMSNLQFKIYQTHISDLTSSKIDIVNGNIRIHKYSTNIRMPLTPCKDLTTIADHCKTLVNFFKILDSSIIDHICDTLHRDVNHIITINSIKKFLKNIDTLQTFDPSKYTLTDQANEFIDNTSAQEIKSKNVKKRHSLSINGASCVLPFFTKRQIALWYNVSKPTFVRYVMHCGKLNYLIDKFEQYIIQDM